MMRLKDVKQNRNKKLKQKNKTIHLKNNRRKQVMKTTINVRKATFKTLALATGMAILSLSVNAQPMFKLTLENPVNFAMAGTNTAFNTNYNSRTFHSLNAARYGAYLAPETEETLEVEAWMTKESNFNTTERATLEAMENFISATEEPLEIEEWMTKENYFSTNEINSFAVSAYLAPATDESLNIESWMLNAENFEGNHSENDVAEINKTRKVFKTDTYIFTELGREEELQIEKWMVNPKIWTK